MKTKSESQCLVQLKLMGDSQLSADEVYRALVFSANSGVLEKQAEHLTLYRRLLLEVRVMMSAGQLEKALEVLKSLKLQKSLPADLEADVFFLLGINAFRCGDKTLYRQYMFQAKQSYLFSNDTYRTLKAAINLDIADAPISSYECGHMKAFAQESVRNEYHDLAGNIYKAESLERFKADDLDGALQAVTQSLKYYELNACPEDLSLTQVLCAILLKLKGDHTQASLMAESAKIRHGKVKEYWMIWSNLKNNQTPVVEKTHQLTVIQWQKFISKAKSLTQKIVSELKTEALSKDEIISRVWGENCIDPSYEARFFSAMQQIKKKNYSVQFDGEKYKIS